MRDSQDLSVGKFLQQERERKNLTLEAVSQVTRISAKTLEAIESDDFLSLPAPIFIRSFLKTYASFIGLNPDKAIALYETQTGVIGLSTSKGLQPEKRGPRRIWLLLIPILIVLIGGGVYWLVSPRKAPPAPSVAPPPPSPAPVLDPAKSSGPPPGNPARKGSAGGGGEDGEGSTGEKAGTSGPPGASKNSDPAPAPASPGASGEDKIERRHILRVQAKEQTWVRVQADDQPEFEVLLEPQEKAVWTARRQLKITLGNAAGLDMAFNGKRLGPFGATGQVVHLQFPLPEGR